MECPIAFRRRDDEWMIYLYEDHIRPREIPITQNQMIALFVDIVPEISKILRGKPAQGGER